tara:strand:- start:4690 stop:5772 length:1083 start_codon:yes stop_codon:yes gene_type:complete
MKHLNKKTKWISIFFILIHFFACDNNTLTQNQYIDPQIIFSSRRWWNYDIFISDIYNSNVTQLTKNKWIDFNPSISNDSKKLLFVSDRDGNREIYITNLEWLDGHMKWRGSNLVNLTNSNENDWTPSFSPVENKIIFSTYFPENDNYDIMLMDDDGKNKENLTNTPSYEKYPQFSPDGSYIIYQGWVGGKMEIFFLGLLDRNIMNITRSAKSNDIISHGNAFSPDGESIVFTSDRDGNKNIYITKINSSEINQLTIHASNDYEPTFSPDGESIVFTSERDGNREIYSIELATKKIKNLTESIGDDWNPRFYPDGRKIVFQSTRDNNWEIYMMNLNGRNQINLTNHPSTDYSFVVLPLINP